MAYYEYKDISEDFGFKLRHDIYQGINLDTRYMSNTKENLLQQLKDAISAWKCRDVRGLWIKVRKDHSWAVPLCTEVGFDFHHAQPGYVMMNQWLAADAENHLPGYATQYLGVAGFVINKKNQLLVIQEKFSPGVSRWKLPGGLANKGEDIGETAIREVFEETGIKTEFVCVLAFRHMHAFRFGCSDFYFACILRPLNEDITHCPQEIANCKWMELEDFLADPHVTSLNKYYAECYKETLKHSFVMGVSQVSSFDMKTTHSVYSVKPFNQ